MKDFSCTYEVERVDTRNFHGWAVFECTPGMKAEIFHSSSMPEIQAFMNDLGA